MPHLLIYDIRWDDEGQDPATLMLPDGVIVTDAPSNWLTPQYRACVLGLLQEITGFLIRDADIMEIVPRPAALSPVASLSQSQVLNRVSLLLSPQAATVAEAFAPEGDALRLGDIAVPHTPAPIAEADMLPGVTVRMHNRVTEALGFEPDRKFLADAIKEFGHYSPVSALANQAKLLEDSLRRQGAKADDPRNGQLYKMRIVIALRENGYVGPQT